MGLYRFISMLYLLDVFFPIFDKAIWEYTSCSDKAGWTIRLPEREALTSQAHIPLQVCGKVWRPQVLALADLG